jgi:GST-like protein
VLNRQLAEQRFIAGQDYSIADMAAWPWYGALLNNEVYNAAEFLDVESYQHVRRWTDEIAQRPAVQRGQRVNKVRGSSPMPERHSAADFLR